MITEHLLRKAVELFTDGMNPSKGLIIDKVNAFLAEANEHLKRCDALQSVIDAGQQITSPAQRREQTNSPWRPNE